MTGRRPSPREPHQETQPETADETRLDQGLLDLHAHIRRAAFEAAYMEMANPDPVSSRFVTLVAAHEERLWEEHQRSQVHTLRSQVSSTSPLAPPPPQSPSTPTSVRGPNTTLGTNASCARSGSCRC